MSNEGAGRHEKREESHLEQVPLSDIDERREALKRAHAAGVLSDKEFHAKMNVLADAASPPNVIEMADRNRWTIIITGALVAIGSLLPWVSAGIFSAAGIEGDGVFTLVFGIIAAALGIRNRASIIVGISVIALGALSMVIAWNILGNFLTDLSLSGPTAGSGLYVVLIAGFVLAAAGVDTVLEPGRARKRREAFEL